MPDETEPKKVLPKFHDYLWNAVKFHPGAKGIAEQFRAAVKWIFDLLRNLLMVEIILFLAMRSKNWWLINLAFVLTGLLNAYVFSYLDTLIIEALPGKPRPFVNGVIHVAIIGGLSIATMIGLVSVVDQIADANLLKP